MKYQCVLLGHSPEVIQAKLNAMENCRIVGVTSIGVNVIAVVENEAMQFDEALAAERVRQTGKAYIDDSRRNHRKS